MDVGKPERSRSVAQKKSTRTVQNLLRLPLVPSEKDNAAPSRTRKLHQPGKITSNHKSGISSTSSSLSKSTVSQQRFPYPRTPRVTIVSEEQLSKRPQSTERRRPSSPSSSLSRTSSSLSLTTTSSLSRPSTPVRDSVVEGHKSSRRSVGGRTGDGLWPSMRNLSISFNSGSMLISPCKKEKEVTLNSELKTSRNVPSERKKTTIRGSNVILQSENSKPEKNSHTRVLDQHKRNCIMSSRLSPGCMTRSLDLTDKVSRTSSLSSSLRGASPTMRNSSYVSSAKLFPKSTSDGTRRMSLDGIGRKELDVSSHLGFSSDSIKQATLLPRSCRTKSLPSSFAQCPSSPSKSSPHPSSPCKTLLRPASPCKTSSRPASPSKVILSSASSRMTASPSRSRPSTPSLSSSTSPARSSISSSLISYIIDAQKGNKNANHRENVHQLRLLYNRHMQWRFINARAETTSSTERMIAESVLYSVWLATSELLYSVTMKKISLQQMKQEIKLDLILKEQMEYLEEWASLEREHFTLLSGAAEALKATIICLPFTGRAKADVFSIKDAISSAVDIMQIMGSSICCLLSMVEGTNSLVSELSSIAAKEYSMLDECRELLASTAAMQVQELSLRTHLLQLRKYVNAVD